LAPLKAWRSLVVFNDPYPIIKSWFTQLLCNFLVFETAFPYKSDCGARTQENVLKMTLSEGDRATIINCFVEKKWHGREICRQFRSKKWAQTTVDRIIRRYEETNSHQGKSATGRPLSATTEAIENEINPTVQEAIACRCDEPRRTHHQ
jgi:hypothetical protein